jgi:MFS family permease
VTSVPSRRPAEHPGIGPPQWRALLAAHLGWTLDGMDVMLYAFALTAVKEEFGIGSAAAGALASVTLVASAIGGTLAGVLADRLGRVRVLVYSILVYSLFTGATATARSPAELAIWRGLVGLGLGAEWSAGSVLVAETWPAEHRGKAAGLMQSGWALGYIMAAGLAAVVLPSHGWRPLFVIGILPALLTLWIRRSVPEPEIWIRSRAAGARPEDRPAPPRLVALVRPPLRRVMVVATLLTTTVLFAYWGLFTWIPAYLASPLGSGGAGMGVTGSFASIASMQVGALLGYLSFGALADRFGRRPVFQIFVGGAALLVLPYAFAARHELLLLGLGALLGFFGHGYFSLFGAMLAELFPSGIRATAQGICYNAGRALSALAPATIGALTDRWGHGTALATTAAFFLAGGILITFLPETRGKELQ